MVPTETPAPQALAPFLQPADLQGLAQLGIDGVLGATGIAESLHHTIASATGIAAPPPAGRPGGITGAVYGAVRGTTRLVGRGLSLALGALARLPPAPGRSPPAREAFLAALNGVLGDHLQASGNPLAIAMSLRRDGRPWQETLKTPTGRLLVLAHGLAMNDLQWQRQGHDHGTLLARECGFTPVYLHYNSGRQVAENGRELAAQLAALVASWPVPVTELVLLGHSMGGLVARSACAEPAAAAWLPRLRALVCLGSPHHGAPLERGGRLVDAALGISPYLAPFARIGQARSAGITDLRHGGVPQVAGLPLYVVAATTAVADRAPHALHTRWVGDGLVPLTSALGDHADPALALNVPPPQRLVVHGANHWDLLNHPAVAAQLCAWLDTSEAGASSAPLPSTA